MKGMEKLKCMGFEVKESKGRQVVLKCPRSDEEKRHCVRGNESGAEIALKVAFVCSDAKCKAALCGHCIK